MNSRIRLGVAAACLALLLAAEPAWAQRGGRSGGSRGQSGGRAYSGGRSYSANRSYSRSRGYYGGNRSYYGSYYGPRYPYYVGPYYGNV